MKPIKIYHPVTVDYSSYTENDWPYTTVTTDTQDQDMAEIAFLLLVITAFKWKDTNLLCPRLPGSAEALARWGGKMSQLLIA